MTANLRSRNLRDRNQGYPQVIHTLPLEERAHADPSTTPSDRRAMAAQEVAALYAQTVPEYYNRDHDNRDGRYR